MAATRRAGGRGRRVRRCRPRAPARPSAGPARRRRSPGFVRHLWRCSSVMPVNSARGTGEEVSVAGRRRAQQAHSRRPSAGTKHGVVRLHKRLRGLAQAVCGRAAGASVPMTSARSWLRERRPSHSAWCMRAPRSAPRTACPIRPVRGVAGPAAGCAGVGAAQAGAGVRQTRGGPGLRPVCGPASASAKRSGAVRPECGDQPCLCPGPAAAPWPAR